MNKRATAYLLLLLSSIIWGVAGPVIKYTLDFLPPFNFLFWRFVITSLVTLPIFVWYLKKHPIKLAWLPHLIVLGVLATTINLSFVFLGFDRTSAMEGTLLGAMSPVFVAIGGIVFLKEKVTRRELAGIALAVGGTVFTVLEPLIAGGFLGREAALGNFFMLLYGISWMIYVLLAKRWAKLGMRPFHVVAVSFFVGPPTFLPAALLERGQLFPLWTVSLNAMAGLLYMSILSSLVAYTAYQVGLWIIEASEADVFNYLHPIWAAPFALTWLGERITLTFLVGAFLIALGVVIAEYHRGLFKKFLFLARRG